MRNSPYFILQPPQQGRRPAPLNQWLGHQQFGQQQQPYPMMNQFMQWNQGQYGNPYGQQQNYFHQPQQQPMQQPKMPMNPRGPIDANPMMSPKRLPQAPYSPVVSPSPRLSPQSPKPLPPRHMY